MIPFPFNENRFSFFVVDHLLVGQLVQIPRAIVAFNHVWKWHNVQRARSKMRHCTTHALYRSKLWQQNHCTLKMQIRTVQRAQGDENKVSSYGYGLWCGFKWGPHHATSHLRSRLESQHQSVPGCAEECDDPLVKSDGRWQTLGVPAGFGAGPQVQSDSGLASEGVLRLFTFLSLAPSSPLDYFVWSYVENITNVTSHNTKASLIATIRRVLSELPPAFVEKACSQFRIPIEAVIEAEGGYIK